MRYYLPYFEAIPMITVLSLIFTAVNSMTCLFGSLCQMNIVFLAEDLKGDSTTSQDFCDDINPYVVVEYGVHAISAVFLLFFSKMALIFRELGHGWLKFAKIFEKETSLRRMHIQRNDILQTVRKQHSLIALSYLLVFLFGFVRFVHLCVKSAITLFFFF